MALRWAQVPLHAGFGLFLELHLFPRACRDMAAFARGAGRRERGSPVRAGGCACRHARAAPEAAGGREQRPPFGAGGRRHLHRAARARRLVSLVALLPFVPGGAWTSLGRVLRRTAPRADAPDKLPASAAAAFPPPPAPGAHPGQPTQAFDGLGAHWWEY